MVDQHHPDLIVAGSDLLVPIEHGQASYSLQGFDLCPVLWVPEKAHYQPLEHLVFITDFTDQDPGVVEHVRALGQTLDARVSVVHFFTQEDRSRLTAIKKQGVALEVALGSQEASFCLVEEEDMIEGLQDYAGRQPVDLFVAATRDTHLTHQYLHSVYRKTQSCQLCIPLLNLFQEKKNPCAGSCVFCRIHQEESHSPDLVKQ